MNGKDAGVQLGTEDPELKVLVIFKETLTRDILAFLSSSILNQYCLVYADGFRSQNSGTVFGFAIFLFQVPQTGTQSESTFSGRAL